MGLVTRKPLSVVQLLARTCGQGGTQHRQAVCNRQMRLPMLVAGSVSATVYCDVCGEQHWHMVWSAVALEAPRLS